MKGWWIVIPVPYLDFLVSKLSLFYPIRDSEGMTGTLPRSGSLIKPGSALWNCHSGQISSMDLCLDSNLFLTCS